MAKEYFVKEEDIDVLKDNVDNKISSPNTAKVGQILSVKAIDGNGKPTEWEVVNKPGSGPGESSPYIYMTQAEYEALTEYEQDKMYWVTYPVSGGHLVWRNGEAINGDGIFYDIKNNENLSGTYLCKPRVVLNKYIYAYRASSSSGYVGNGYHLRLSHVDNACDEIKDYAFCGSSNSRNNYLKEINFGSNLKSIGAGAFSYCSFLTSIFIPDNVTSLGASAFHTCTSLTSVTIGNGVTSIGNSTFLFCDELKTVTIGNGIEAISSYTFGSNNGANYDEKLELIIINKPQGSVSGAPWGAKNATVVWTG